MIISFNQVDYVYQQGPPYEYQALNEVVTSFEAGKYYAIIGQTGSGKSTLIQHMNGLLKPTNGTMEVLDVTVTSKTKDKAMRDLRKRIGMVFQFPEAQLFEDSVEQEILFGPKNFQMDLDRVKARALDMLIHFGFSRDVMQQSPFQMSGGQMRKIALTSILAMDPDVIILDEPTAGLDPQSKQQVMSFIKHLQQDEEKTIILITHEMNDVAAYADEVKVMKAGKVVNALSPVELFSDSRYLDELHLAKPDVVQLQRDVEDKHGMRLPQLALTEEAFVEMYKEWRQHER